MRWTPAEIEYLETHASDGAEAIGESLGRSVHAVESMASRCGISLRRSWLCPRCGREVFQPLSVRSGWCRLCSIQDSHDKSTLRNREIKKAIAIEESRIHEAERDRQATYAETSRNKEKLCGLREV